MFPNAENTEGWDAFEFPKAEVPGWAPNEEFIWVGWPKTEDVWGAPNVEVDGGFKGLFVAVVAKTDVGGGPKDDNVIVPGCDPPGPSVDGCPNAEVCCGLPNAEGVGFED